MDRAAAFCRLSGVADQDLLGVQPREEDQLVHPGRAVNTLFTFLRQPECWDEPKAAFLEQRPDRSPSSRPASPQPMVLSRKAWPQFVRTPPGGKGWYGSLGFSAVWIGASTTTFQIPDTTSVYSSTLMFASSTAKRVLTRKS